MSTYTREEIQSKIVAIIAEKLQIESALVVGTATLQDLGADSLDIVEIVMQIEDRIGVAINDVDAEKLHTVDDVISYVYGLRRT